MAATTLTAIIDRFQAVCEGGNVNLKKTTDEFSFERQPNARMNNVYRIEDGGLISSETITNDVEVRVDELSIWIARKGTLANEVERETLETDLLTIERQIVADGPANNYHADITGREVERVDDLLIARLGMAVDYDVSLSTA